MKQVFNGKIYNTDTAQVLAKVSAYNNGNYSGSDHLMATTKGVLFFYQSSNGQDCYRDTYIEPLSMAGARERINGWNLHENEIELLTKYGVVDDA